MRTDSWREPIQQLITGRLYQNGEFIRQLETGPGISYNEYFYEIIPLYESNDEAYFYEIRKYKNGKIIQIHLEKRR